MHCAIKQGNPISRFHCTIFSTFLCNYYVIQQEPIFPVFAIFSQIVLKAAKKVANAVIYTRFGIH